MNKPFFCYPKYLTNQEYSIQQTNFQPNPPTLLDQQPVSSNRTRTQQQRNQLFKQEKAGCEPKKVFFFVVGGDEGQKYIEGFCVLCKT